MLAISLVVGSFLVVGALLLGTMLGWVLREYMMYHHDKNNNGAELHPEMYDENGNVLPDSLIAFRFENNSDDDYED
jgi:hypothetical protein|tara:strand:- start:1021 stop:1248 length:228 start_codon:yes stop_codon:yes gene_type:complete